MSVFKAYFKIIRRNMGMLLMYLGIFVAVSMIITGELRGRAITDFAQARVDIAVLNEDGNEALAGGLAAYIGENATLVKVDDSSQAVQDALFYGNINYALRIPAGFSKAFMQGDGSVSLQKVASSGLDTGVSADFMVERYLRLAQLHAAGQPGATQQEIAEAVAKDIGERADVTVNLYGGSAQTNDLSYYFRYLAYCILAILIIGVTSCMMVLNDADLSNRTLCAPVPPLRMNLQLLLGNGTFALLVWAVCCAVSFAVYGSVPLNAGTLLLCVNALAVTLVALSIAFLAGKFIKDHGVQSAVSNVVSLGLSFLSGVFVEQELLGENILRFARFEPVYWYVKAADGIRNLSDYSFKSIAGVLNAILIQLGFAVVIFLVTLALSKQLRPKREI